MWQDDDTKNVQLSYSESDYQLDGRRREEENLLSLSHENTCCTHVLVARLGQWCVVENVCHKKQTLMIQGNPQWGGRN